MTDEIGVGLHKNDIPAHLVRSVNFDHDTPILIENAQMERSEGFVRPASDVKGSNGPYELTIPAVQDAFLVMTNLALYTRCKVVKSNGTDLAATDVVAPVNQLSTAMWEFIEIFLNDFNISQTSSSNTNYKTNLETVLSYDVSEKSRSTYLAATGFSLDTPGHFNSMTEVTEPNGAGNHGYTDRYKMVKNSREFDMMTPVTADFVRAQKHLAPGNKLSLRFGRAKDSFVLNTASIHSYKLIITDLRLYFMRVRATHPIPRTERYLVTRTELKKYPVPSGVLNHNCSIHMGGKMPKSVIVAQVNTEACEGDYDQNPFYYQHFDIGRIQLTVGTQRMPADALEPNFGQGLVAREYVNMFMNTGGYRMNRGNCITYPAFKDGLTIFPFDLNPDMCNGYHMHESGVGNIELSINWRNRLESPITILVHLSYDEVIMRAKNQDGYVIETI